MEIYDVLKTDHRHLQTLLEKLVAASKSDNENWKELVNEVADELIPHSRAEEAVLYNSLRDAGREGIMGSYGEHMMAETLLRSLQAMKAIDANWTTVAMKLKNALDHHIQEEEQETFAEAQATFSNEEATQMAEAFNKMKPVVRDESMLHSTWDMIVNLMPPRLMRSFRDSSHSRA
jgi:hemerythrin superfamily protein